MIGVADHHLDGLAGLISGLVDLDLFLQVALELAVAGQFELDQGLVGSADADLVVDGAAAVVGFAVDVEGAAEPDQAEVQLHLLLLSERLATPIDQLPAVLILDVPFEAFDACIALRRSSTSPGRRSRCWPSSPRRLV